MATQSKPNKKRYDGKDNQPWKVTTASGEQVIKESFDGFAGANNAAIRFTEQTGEFASAKRA